MAVSCLSSLLAQKQNSPSLKVGDEMYTHIGGKNPGLYTAVLEHGMRCMCTGGLAVGQVAQVIAQLQTRRSHRLCRETHKDIFHNYVCPVNALTMDRPLTVNEGQLEPFCSYI